MTDDRTQLKDLAKRIPDRYIQQKPGKFAADYVSHGDITQILLAKLGPFDQRIIEVIRNPEGVVDGVVLEMRFVVDGKEVTVQEIGSEDRPGPAQAYVNDDGKYVEAANNGENLKNCVSDAVKRCAMRVGLGLHLWCQEHYVLDVALNREAGDE